jgi:hypothetical protein
MPYRSQKVVLAVGCLVLTAAGCSRDAAAPVHTAAPSNAQMQEFGRRFAAGLGASLSSVMPSGMVNRSAVGAGAAPGASLSDQSPGSPCPAVSNPTDSDHDGVPDDAVLSFTLPACRFVTGTDTVEITGTVRLQDPVNSPPPNMTAFGYVATFDHLRMHAGHANPDSDVTDTRSGTEAMMMNPQGLNQGHEFTISHEDAQGVAAIQDGWNAGFAPDPGATVVPGQPLPSGVFVINGMSSFARGGNGFQFIVGTAAPLRYDPSCPDSSPNRFRSGELRAHMASPQQQAFVRIVFADCKDPTITPVPSS